MGQCNLDPNVFGCLAFWRFLAFLKEMKGIFFAKLLYALRAKGVVVTV
jgi:hypothetical protein